MRERLTKAAHLLIVSCWWQFISSIILWWKKFEVLSHDDLMNRYPIKSQLIVPLASLLTQPGKELQTKTRIVSIWNFTASSYLCFFFLFKIASSKINSNPYEKGLNIMLTIFCFVFYSWCWSKQKLSVTYTSMVTLSRFCAIYKVVVVILNWLIQHN